MKDLLLGDPKNERPRLISDNVAVGNFKAVEGSNDYQSVRFQIIVSRPQPPTSVLQMRVEILSGEVIDNTSSYWDGLSVIETPTDYDEGRDGALFPLNDVTHPHAMMAAVLRETCHSAVQQADRGRGARRAGDKPLLTILMNDVPISHNVNRHINADDAFHWSTLCAMQGVLPDLSVGNRGVASTIAKLLPEKYADAEAIKTARRSQYDEVYGSPFDKSWHLKFHVTGDRYCSHVVVNASSKAEAISVLLRAIPDVESTIRSKQRQEELRPTLRGKATKETELWNR